MKATRVLFLVVVLSLGLRAQPVAESRTLSRPPASVPVGGRAKIFELRPGSGALLHMVIYPTYLELWRSGVRLARHPHPHDILYQETVEPWLGWVDPKTRKIPLVLAAGDGGQYVFAFPKGWSGPLSTQFFQGGFTSISGTSVELVETPDARGFVQIQLSSSQKDDPNSYDTLFEWDGQKFSQKR